MKIRIKNIKKLPKAQFAGEILKQISQSLPKPSTITATSDPKFVNISSDDANQNNNGKLVNNLPNVWNKFGEENAPTFKTPDQPEMYKISEENKKPVDKIKLGTEKEKQPFNWNQLNDLLNTSENVLSQMSGLSKQYKNTRMLNQAKLNQAFNQNIMPGGNKGGYDINTGMLPYNSANQGMYSNPFYSPQQFRQIGGQTGDETIYDTLLDIPESDVEDIIAPSDFDTLQQYNNTAGVTEYNKDKQDTEYYKNKYKNEERVTNINNALKSLFTGVGSVAVSNAIGNAVNNRIIRNKIAKDLESEYAQKHLQKIVKKEIKSNIKKGNILFPEYFFQPNTPSFISKLKSKGFPESYTENVINKYHIKRNLGVQPQDFTESSLIDDISNFAKQAGKTFMKKMENPKAWFKKEEGGQTGFWDKVSTASDYAHDYLTNYNILDFLGHAGNPIRALQAVDAAHNNPQLINNYRHPLNASSYIRNTADIGQYAIPYYGAGLLASEIATLLPSKRRTAAEKIGEIASLAVASKLPKAVKQMIKNPEMRKAASAAINGFNMYGRITKQFGGNTSSLVKIKIKATNQEQPSMAYGGQSNYSLDANRDYSMFDDDNYDSVSNTLQPVDRSLANVEAEKGETVYGDLDGDGGLEHMKIGGKRHHSGGTPLNLPEDSFIYSDTKKMKIKDEVSLAFFGLKPKTGGYTPAEIAKKYDVNKYKAVMEDPNADDLDKSTAQLMVKNYNDKLSRLALIQEEMKGFPQGIPEVAKEYAIEKGMINPEQSSEEMIEPIDDQEEMQEEPMMRYGGGLPKAQFGMDKKDVAKNIINNIIGNASPLVVPYSSDILENLNVHRGDLYSGKNNASKYSKEQWVEKLRNKGYTGNFKNDDVQKWLYSTDQGRKIVDRLHAQYGEPTKGMFDSILGIRWDDALDAVPDKIKQKLVNKVASEEAENNTAYNTKNTTPLAFIKPESKRKPFRYTTPDIVNMAAAAANAPELILGYNPQMPFTPGNVMLQDPRAQLAAQQAAYNSYADTIGAYAPSQSISAALSYAQAQQADKAAQILAQNQAANVAIANQFSQQERQRQDQNNLFNLGQKQQNWKDYATAKQNYRQERVDYTKANADAFTKAWDNRMKMNLMNETNRRYNIDPITGKMYFINGYSADNFGQEGASQSEQYIKDFIKLKQKFPDLTEKQYINLMSGNKESKYGGPIKKKKKGGQVNPIFDMLSRGYSYPF